VLQYILKEEIIMEEVKLRAGASIDEAVEILLKHKAEGKQVYCDFYGHKLYSDTVFR
jgi:hypothetical protein